jgi:hypothetical protein
MSDGNRNLHQGMLPEHAEAFTDLVKGNITPGKYILESVNTGIKNRTKAVSLRRDSSAATINLLEVCGLLEKAQKLMWGFQILVGGSLAKAQAIDEIRGTGGDPDRVKELERLYKDWTRTVAKQHGAKHLSCAVEVVFHGTSFQSVADARNLDFRTVKRYTVEAIATEPEERQAPDITPELKRKWKWWPFRKEE